MNNEWTDQDVEQYYETHPEQRPGKRDSNARLVNIPVNSAPATSKYRAQRTNGYASKKEAQFAADLVLRKAAGEVWFWLEQVPFKLPGGSKHRVDFMVFYPLPKDILLETPIERWELIEIKGRDLPMGKLKRQQVEELYNVKITLV